MNRVKTAKALLHRRIATYAALVGIPTFLLILHSVYADHEKNRIIVTLKTTNARLHGEQLTNEVERIVRANAEDCLLKVATADIGPRDCARVKQIYVIENGSTPRSKLLDPETARIADDLCEQSSIPLDRVRSLAYAEPFHAQLFYMPVVGRFGSSKVIAVSMDLDVIARVMFPDLARQEHLDAKLAHREGPDDHPAQGLFFRSLFPFWKIMVTESGEQLPPALPSLLGIAVLAGGVLCSSVLWLLREGAERTRFLGSVTHAFKTPLANVRLYAELLKSEQTTRQNAQHCDAIVFQSLSLTREIDKLLMASRIENVTRTYELQCHDIVAVVDEVLSGYATWFDAEQFHVTADLPEGPVYVAIDKTAVADALVHVIENAVKYSTEVREARVQITTHDGTAYVAVRDFGTGISRRDQRKIFQPFFRGSSHRAMGGVGLGLFIVAETMRANGGRVEVSSVEGAGSQFRLIFPLCRPS